MKTWIVFLSAIALVNITFAEDCDKLPENLSLEGCCKFPILDSDGAVKKVSEQFKDKKYDQFMMECKVTEAMFKELKLIKNDSVDKEAMINHLDREVKDPNWKPVMKAACEECYKDIMAEKDKIIRELEKEPFNIKKDQCNGLFMSMVTCVHLEGFTKCPKNAWTEDKKCNDTRVWIEKCGDDIDSLRQLMVKPSK